VIGAESDQPLVPATRFIDLMREWPRPSSIRSRQGAASIGPTAGIGPSHGTAHLLIAFIEALLPCRSAGSVDGRLCRAERRARVRVSSPLIVAEARDRPEAVSDGHLTNVTPSCAYRWCSHGR
jgi:hypothetical protein